MDNGTNNKPFDWHSGRNTRVFLCGECDGHLSRVCTQLRWRVSGPKKWCLLSFKVAGFSQAAVFLTTVWTGFQLETLEAQQKENKENISYTVVTRSIHLKDTPLFHSNKFMDCVASPSFRFNRPMQCTSACSSLLKRLQQLQYIGISLGGQQSCEQLP